MSKRGVFEKRIQILIHILDNKELTCRELLDRHMQSDSISGMNGTLKLMSEAGYLRFRINGRGEYVYRINESFANRLKGALGCA